MKAAGLVKKLTVDLKDGFTNKVPRSDWIFDMDCKVITAYLPHWSVYRLRTLMRPLMHAQMMLYMKELV